MIVKVNDRWMFFLLYPVIAILSVHIGNDNTLGELLRLPSYYTDLLFALVFAYSAGWYFRWLFIRLEKRFNWDTSLRQRLIYQFIYGCLVPVITIIAFEMMYLELFLGIPVSQSSIFYLEMPVVAVFCIIINLIYLMLYHRQHYFVTTGNLIKESAERGTSVSTSPKNNFVIHSGVKSINIQESEVAYFMVQQKSTFLVVKDGRQYLYDDTLEQTGKKVSPCNFFQLNRQIIANRRSIVSYERTNTRKLCIELTPKTTEPVFVSKIKTAEFLRWLQQK